MGATLPFEPSAITTANSALAGVVAIWIAPNPKEYWQDLLKVFFSEMLLPAMENCNADGMKSAEHYFSSVAEGKITKNEFLPQVLVVIDFFVQATKAYFFGNRNEAWFFAAETKYWAGRAHASCQLNEEKIEEGKTLVASLLKEFVSEQSKKAINARHDKPGGSREKRRKIQEIWSYGKYTSRDICAQEEAGYLGMSFKAARNALRNTPEPDRT
jgi:hypothetical protein